MIERMEESINAYSYFNLLNISIIIVAKMDLFHQIIRLKNKMRLNLYFLFFLQFMV
jgi:hypothetical protein